MGLYLPLTPLLGALIQSHQPSGLRWFRFKTLPIFQLGRFTPPPTPYPGVWIEAVAGCHRTFIRCSFRAPFFSPLGTPQNRYHKLFRLQSDPILRSKTRSKTSSHFGTGFFSVFSRFCDFFHTPSSASRIAPAISKPLFRLSSFLLFLLSLRLCFKRLFGPKWVPKRNPKRNPKLDPSKSCVPPKKKPCVPKRGLKWDPQRGGNVACSSPLCCVAVFC